MNRKLMLAMMALLGFSAACTSVKNAPRQGEQPDSVARQGEDPALRRIVVMYGVPVPKPVVVQKDKTDTLQHLPTSSVFPVLEKPSDN